MACLIRKRAQLRILDLQSPAAIALPGIYDVLVNGNEPKARFPFGTETSVVFFSRSTQPGVRIDRVEINDHTITVRYMLLSHGHLSRTWTLAIIPCGKLPPGEYNVRMVRSKHKEEQFNQRDFPPVERGVDWKT